MAEKRRTEIRFEVEADELAVLDGWCQATGQDRTTVVRKILREWSEREHHKAMVICRVAGCNPASSEGGR